MNDYERFEKLIAGGYSCISIIMDEGQYALDIIRKAARKFGRDLWI